MGEARPVYVRAVRSRPGSAVRRSGGPGRAVLVGPGAGGRGPTARRSVREGAGDGVRTPGEGARVGPAWVTARPPEGGVRAYRGTAAQRSGAVTGTPRG